MCAAGKRSLLEESVETNDETACLPNRLNLEERRCCVTKWTDLQKNRSGLILLIDVIPRTLPGFGSYRTWSQAATTSASAAEWTRAGKGQNVRSDPKLTLPRWCRFHCGRGDAVI